MTQGVGFSVDGSPSVPSAQLPLDNRIPNTDDVGKIMHRVLPLLEKLPFLENSIDSELKNQEVQEVFDKAKEIGTSVLTELMNVPEFHKSNDIVQAALIFEKTETCKCDALFRIHLDCFLHGMFLSELPGILVHVNCLFKECLKNNEDTTDKTRKICYEVFCGELEKIQAKTMAFCDGTIKTPDEVILWVQIILIDQKKNTLLECFKRNLQATEEEAKNVYSGNRLKHKQTIKEIKEIRKILNEIYEGEFEKAKHEAINKKREEFEPFRKNIPNYILDMLGNNINATVQDLDGKLCSVIKTREEMEYALQDLLNEEERNSQDRVRKAKKKKKPSAVVSQEKRLNLNPAKLDPAGNNTTIEDILCSFQKPHPPSEFNQKGFKLVVDKKAASPPSKKPKKDRFLPVRVDPRVLRWDQENVWEFTKFPDLSLNGTTTRYGGMTLEQLQEQRMRHCIRGLEGLVASALFREKYLLPTSLGGLISVAFETSSGIKETTLVSVGLTGDLLYHVYIHAADRLLPEEGELLAHLNSDAGFTNEPLPAQIFEESREDRSSRSNNSFQEGSNTQELRSTWGDGTWSRVVLFPLQD